MRLQDVMSKNVATIASRETSQRANTLMRLRDVHHLVVMEGPRVAGVVSARDLRGVGQGVAVSDLMARDFVTAKPETTIRQAANLMRGRAVGSLPVMQGGRLVGIVTISDLLELVGRGAVRPVEKVKRWTLKHRGDRPAVRRAKLARAK